MKLIIVSTPIGNLKDLSFRALEVLQSVDYILCEDTRHAQKLKTHYGLKPRLISFHEHNEATRIPQILQRMEKGKTFALISDAGMPLVSDPGHLLIQELIRNEIPFTCVPGPSAVITALVLSGFPANHFSFRGFLPNGASARKQVLNEMQNLHDQTLVLLESPLRVLGLLREIGEILGDRQIALCREMTKLHEEVLRGKISEIAPILASRKMRGEFTVVIAPGKEEAIQMDDATILAHYHQLLHEGLSGKEALKKVAKESGRPRNELYALIHKSR